MGPPASPSRLVLALPLAVAVLAVVVSAFAPRDLWAPDEPRYGQVAREMLRDGDLLVPHVNGVPYPEKPPLWFWFATAVARPWGEVTAWSARLASALLAAAAVLLTARLGRRLFGDAEAGTTAALLFASMGLVVWNAPRAGLDLPLTCLVLLAVERGYAWWEGGRLFAAVLAGAAWAGAILTKGPVGFFLPPLVLFGGALAARRAPRLSNVGWWLAPLVMVALCLAWLLPAMQAGGEAYADRLLGQLGARATGEGGGHVRWAGYYPTRVVVHLLPWTLHVLAGLAVVVGWRRRPAAHRFGLGAALAGSVGLLVVLSCFATKREVYLIPGLPFAALLAAYAVRQGLAPRLQTLGRMLVVACLILFAVAALAAPLAVGRAAQHEAEWAVLASPDLATWGAAALGGLGLLAAAIWTARHRHDVSGAVRGGALFVLLGAAFLHVVAVPLLDPAKSYARVAEAAEAASAGGEIHVAGWYRTANLLWATGRTRIGEIHEPAEAARRLRADGPPAAIVFERRSWERWRDEGDRALGAARVAWTGRVGNRRLVVVTNR